MTAPKPHIVERDSPMWKSWRKGHGRCVVCDRKWVPKNGWLGPLVQHLDPRTDRLCPSRRWKGQP